MLSLLEIDETFKGRKISLLVVIDTMTGYIFHLQWLKSRSKKGILDTLASKRELFYNVVLVLTDGAPYFPEVVKELCPFAKHQQCLIHVMRNLYPHLRPVQGKFRKAQTKLQALRLCLKEKKLKLKGVKSNLKKWKQKDSYWTQKRENAHIRLNIRRYQRNILNRHPCLKKINLKINEIKSYLRAAQISELNHKSKINQKILEISLQEEVTHHLWGIYMRELNLLYRFYDLFHLTDKNMGKKDKNYSILYPIL